MKTIKIKTSLTIWKLLDVAFNSVGAVYLLTIIPGTAHLSLDVNGTASWILFMSITTAMLYVGDMGRRSFFGLNYIELDGLFAQITTTVGVAIIVTAGICFTSWLVPGSIFYSSGSGVLQLMLIICAFVNLNCYVLGRGETDTNSRPGF